MRLFVLCIVFLAITSLSVVAESKVYGNIYDEYLNKASNVVVEVNSQPTQRMLAVNGSYSFYLSPGNYTISARSAENQFPEAFTQERFDLVQEGEYVLDIFLVTDLEEEITLFEENVSVDPMDFGSDSNIFLYIIFVIIIVIGVLAIGVYLSLKKNNRESQDIDTINQVISVIKKLGGRATQKQIRSSVDLSEVNVSLILKELQKNGTIVKIRKGRENIIIIKK